MSDSTSLGAWNARVLDLMQALLGVISPNFRMVALGRDREVWTITIVLEVDDYNDREEIDDLAAEFDALQTTDLPRRFDVVVNRDPLPWPPAPTRVVYRRREPNDDV